MPNLSINIPSLSLILPGGHKVFSQMPDFAFLMYLLTACLLEILTVKIFQKSLVFNIKYTPDY